MTFSITKLYCRCNNIIHMYRMQINMEIKALCMIVSQLLSVENFLALPSHTTQIFFGMVFW